jgi:hypothetical protein
MRAGSWAYCAVAAFVENNNALAVVGVCRTGGAGRQTLVLLLVAGTVSKQSFEYLEERIHLKNSKNKYDRNVNNRKILLFWI